MGEPRYIPQYTVADYEQWAGDWELWHGVAVAMTPSPNFRHGVVAVNLVRRLLDALGENGGCDCRVVQEIDWRIASDLVVRPDISVMCEPVETEFIESPPSLIAEVLSPATAMKDRTLKRRLYAEQGVGVYVLADPETRELTVLRRTGDEYVAVDGSPPRVALHAGCEITLDAAGLWD